MIDPEHDDALDHLTSEELEAQAFGPAPQERRTIRGLIDRPPSGGVVYRVAERKRRWPLVLGAVVAAVVAFAAVDLTLGTPGGPDVFVLADGPDDAAIEAAVEAEMDAFEAEMEAAEAEIEAEMEAMEEAAEVLEESNETMEEVVGPGIEE